MQVKIFSVNQDTGAETFDREGWLSDILDPADSEYPAIYNNLENYRRAWVGGGASPLFYFLVV